MDNKYCYKVNNEGVIDVVDVNGFITSELYDKLLNDEDRYYDMENDAIYTRKLEVAKARSTSILEKLEKEKNELAKKVDEIEIKIKNIDTKKFEDKFIGSYVSDSLAAQLVALINPDNIRLVNILSYEYVSQFPVVCKIDTDVYTFDSNKPKKLSLFLYRELESFHVSGIKSVINILEYDLRSTLMNKYIDKCQYINNMRKYVIKIYDVEDHYSECITTTETKTLTGTYDSYYIDNDNISDIMIMVRSMIESI